MEISGLLLKMTGAAINAIMKTTNASIRTHGEENIPAEPVLYVINHFTRMETFFLPYVINKLTGKVVLSLAHHSFFGGGFGRYLNKIGAISTDDADRFKILSSNLLTGDMASLIYPEGQMIKDKKIVEKGKFMIYNTGMRRPPHTGAALLALRAEFFREKLRYYREIGYTRGINQYRDYFGLKEPALDALMKRETCVVPVNITYFPIRARNNALNRIARRFAGKLPERVDEELEVEGTMIIDGVDIDINFGAPIRMGEYMKSGRMMKHIRNEKPYLFDEDMQRDLSMSGEALRLMYRYMNSIYAMTTVNHDHIFSYLLTRYGKTRIPESDFKNRSYLAIDHLRDVHIESHHTSLKYRQGFLLSDDVHDRYESFIQAAKSDGVIRVEDGIIIKNRERFSRAYEFHTIRADNIVEVLKNEIEPMPNLVKAFNRIMMLPEFMVRRAIRKKFLARDEDKFNRDYRKFYIREESKPENIGRPFLLKHFWGNRRGVIVVHGYLAAPEEVRALAQYLYRHGYAVYVVRLRGHGTSHEDLATRRWESWYQSVNRGYVIMKNLAKEFAIVGFSTGADLSLFQASLKNGRFKCVVSINGPLDLKNIASNFASSVVLWNKLLDRMHIRKGRYEFAENRPENPHINYFKNPIAGVKQLERFMTVVRDNLKNVAIPALIIQASHDPVVNPQSADEIFNKISSQRREIIKVNAARHGIVNGEGSVYVFRRVRQFLDEIFGVSGD